MERIYNFSAGPAVLPVDVLEEASHGVREIAGSGMSILEVSHRGKQYEAIHFAAMVGVLRVLGLSADDYSVLFMGGGASFQFHTLPVNFLSAGQTADYVDTDDWSAKAAKEARRIGNVQIAGSSKATGYDHIPTELSFSPTGAVRYAHITTNNTIVGTQWHTFPDTNSAPLCADMSSDIFAVRRPFDKFALIYAGAQKNAGAAGVTIVVIRKDFLTTANPDITPMLSYATQAEAQSLYNTPPVFSVYVLGLVLNWIEKQGGIAALEQKNREKAQIVYDTLDNLPHFYKPCVAKADRSLMNITFRLANPDLEAALLKETMANGMDGLKGHRSVGGFRASVYNAFPVEGCRALAQLLTDFARRNG